MYSLHLYSLIIISECAVSCIEVAIHNNNNKHVCIILLNIEPMIIKINHGYVYNQLSRACVEGPCSELQIICMHSLKLKVNMILTSRRPHSLQL